MITHRAARSFLYTPGIHVAGSEKAAQAGADVAIFDLEDSVPAASREKARELAADWVARERPCLSGVRINSLRTPDALRDLLAIQAWPVPPVLVVMTMVDDAEEVRIVRDQFRLISAPPAIYVTVETPRCIGNLYSIAAASDGLIFGSADFAASLGVPITWESMLHARQVLVTAAAAAGIPAVDTACYDLHGHEVHLNECLQTRAMGFTAKVAVHPSQVETINRTFSPSSDDVAAAQAVLQEFTRSEGRISSVNGMMIGPPFVALARKILARADRGAESSL